MSWLFANSLVAALLAALVLAAGPWLRSRPAVAHGLWLLVLLKLVTPPLFAVPVDLAWLQPAAAQSSPTMLLSMAPSMPGTLCDFAVEPSPPRTAAAAPPAVSTARTAADWCLYLWLAGTAVFFVTTMLGVLGGARHLRRLGPVPPVLQREVQDLAKRLGIAPPPLLADASSPSPYVWSLGRTRLVLPVAVLMAATTKGRHAVLAHELAHLRRRDHWVAHLELLFAWVLWWHPLFWFARSRLRLSAELACDAWALTSVPAAAIDYATVLIEAVARPDPAVPGLTVLAARPAARAAFERRLTMILNETVHCRISRAWWLPLTTTLLASFAVPVAAQNEEAPARVEVRVNGKSVEELSRSERRALLERLLATEEHAAEQATERAEAKTAQPKPKAVNKGKSKGKVNLRVADDAGGTIEMGDFHEALRQGLAEARVEIANDKDLRELGITDQVSALLDDLGNGKGIEGSLDQLVKAAMKGAGRMAMKELQADPELRQLGLTEGIGKLVTGLLENERNQEMLGDFVQHAAKSAMKEAMKEIRADKDLRQLGITKDVEGLVNGLFSGGDFDADLQRIIDKAMQAAGAVEKAGGEAEPDADEPAPQPKKVRKAKKPKQVDVLDPVLNTR